MTVADLASMLLVAAGLVSGVVVLGATRRAGTAMAAMLELWTAAGLVRLSADARWSALAIAALLVVLRRVLSASMRPLVDATRPADPRP